MLKKIAYPQTPKDLPNVGNYQALKENWGYSCSVLNSVCSQLHERLDMKDVSVVVAGSHGRLDASRLSDFDYMILTEAVIDAEHERLDKVRTVVADIVSSMGIPLPSPSGVFGEFISIDKMVDSIGSKGDDLAPLAQRMLLLMETKAVYNETLFRSVVDRLLRKYLALVIDDPTKEALFLLNDVIRYFRSICVNYQFNFWKDEDKWVIRNVKLRHSRIIMYAGLLLIILNASSSKYRGDKFQYLQNQVYLTPVEKIIHVYQSSDDYYFSRVLGIYDIFLRRISDPDVRNQLKADYPERYQNKHYSELKVLSDGLQTELTRFIFAQKGRWTDQIYEYLVF